MGRHPTCEYRTFSRYIGELGRFWTCPRRFAQIIQKTFMSAPISIHMFGSGSLRLTTRHHFPADVTAARQSQQTSSNRRGRMDSALRSWIFSTHCEVRSRSCKTWSGSTSIRRRSSSLVLPRRSARPSSSIAEAFHDRNVPSSNRLPSTTKVFRMA